METMAATVDVSNALDVLDWVINRALLRLEDELADADIVEAGHAAGLIVTKG